MEISVIIPTYKPGDYIYECLDSLRQQTIDKESFEVLLVLNGCCEPWRSRLTEYVELNVQLPHFRLFQTDTAGVSNARNIGMVEASGEYIAFVDDDDFLSPSYLEGLRAASSPTCVGLSNTVGFNDGDGAIIPDYYLSREYVRLTKITPPLSRLAKNI